MNHGPQNLLWDLAISVAAGLIVALILWLLTIVF